MDGRGRLGQTLKRLAASLARRAVARLRPFCARLCLPSIFALIEPLMQACAAWVAERKPRFFGLAATAALLAAVAIYGGIKGEHGASVIEALKGARDAAANAAGFRIALVSVAGRRQLSEQEVLAAAGVTERASLLFLDVDEARRRLEAVPWIAQATVRKLYPGQLEIAIQEREAFAFWQKNGKVSVIAADGAVLGPVEERRLPLLPLVVGPGAAGKARDLLAVLERYPLIREQLRAAVFVAERRWNLKLKTGLDVRLPASGIERALDLLIALDRDKKLLSRDITAIDLRLPDRVTVRLSDEAAQAREDAAKDKKKRKGGAV